MRAVLLALFVLGCGQAAAQTPESQMFAGGSPGDHAIARACMDEGRACEHVIQQACEAQAAADGDDLTGVAARICDWRALGVWQDVMDTTLAALNRRLSEHDRKDLDRSQRAWRQSLAADADVAVDAYQGGTYGGRVRASVLAIATAQRAQYLISLNGMFE